MKSKCTVSDVLVLQNGNIAITGVSEIPLPLIQRGKAITASREIEVEIVSVGLANPTPVDSRQELQVRLLKGRSLSLKGAILFIEA